MTVKTKLPLIAIAVGMTCIRCLAAAEGEDEDIALAYGDKSFVSIATGSRQPVTRAPAVATVITAEEITASGATNLDQVLEAVPGLHVTPGVDGGLTSTYIIRGVARAYNPQVLLLVNGVPRTSVFEGNRGDVLPAITVANIARIEVVRGPGSALYGAEAFAGVINIITKTADEINGTQVSARGGSFDSKDVWLLNGEKLGPIQFSGYFHAGQTNGYNATITSDDQTTLDKAFGTHASHAPGPMSNGYKSLDGQVDMAWNKWRWRADIDRYLDVGTGVGVAGALDPVGHSTSLYYTSDLIYQDNTLFRDWDIGLRASYYHYDAQTYLDIFPPGAFGGIFPDGMIGAPAKWERHESWGGTAVYTGWIDQRLRFGLGHENAEIYKTSESKNFGFVYVPQIGGYFPSPLGSIEQATPATIYFTPRARSSEYVYVQDEWNVAKDWYLTAGVRNDHYSDFGDTTNPRLAIVWEAAYNLTAKLLYGTAFRAPSFSELYDANNPALIGNPNAKPEKMKTTEAAISWQPRADMQLGLNIFRYEMTSILRVVPSPDPVFGSIVENDGNQKGRGVELEASWDVNKQLRLSGNYAYQRSTDEVTNHDAGNAPHNQLYGRADWRLTPDWMLNAQAKWIAGRDRAAGDPRPNLPDYGTMDLTVRHGNDHSTWDIALSVRNAFNSNGREPDITETLPNDVPIAGRSWWVTASSRF